ASLDGLTARVGVELLIDKASAAQATAMVGETRLVFNDPGSVSVQIETAGGARPEGFGERASKGAYLRRLRGAGTGVQGVRGPRHRGGPGGQSQWRRARNSSCDRPETKLRAPRCGT